MKLLAIHLIVILAKLLRPGGDRALESRDANDVPRRGAVAAGGTDVLWASLKDMFVRSAYYIDRLRKGAKVADLPIEQASEFKLVANLKTAKALALTIPASILQRADEVMR
jgi:putative ABC transport system substrate-binding protein